VLRCPDDLFDLPAPAALWRGQGGIDHGSRIDGRCFFAGELDEQDPTYHWGQSGGVNAGVMLLAPDAELYERVLREVKAPQRVCSLQLCSGRS